MWGRLNIARFRLALAVIGKYMNDDRFVRWQGQTIAQLSTSLSVLSVLSLGGLGLCATLAQKQDFHASGKLGYLFVISIGAFFAASASSLAAMITRLLDFRLTAKKLRLNATQEPLTMFGSEANAYGRATWRLFWSTVVCLIAAIACCSIVIGRLYLLRFISD
jgi:hypothetical protein